MRPDGYPSPFSLRQPSGNYPCYCGRHRDKRNSVPARFYPGRVPAWSSDPRGSGWGEIHLSVHSKQELRQIAPVPPQCPGRIRDIQCRRTCGLARGQYLSLILYGRSAIHLGRDRSPVRLDRKRRLQRHSGYGLRFFRRLARYFYRPAFAFRVRLFLPFLTR